VRLTQRQGDKARGDKVRSDLEIGENVKPIFFRKCSSTEAVDNKALKIRQAKFASKSVKFKI
jgi:hypothetical protein